MNGETLPGWLKEVIVTLVINLIVGVIIFVATKSLFIAIVTFLAAVASVIIGLNLYRIIRVVKDSGLSRIFNDSPDPTPLLRRYFETSSRIRLLSIRGARMMGTDRGLINYVISQLPRSWNGEIQVLLLNPDSPHFRQRAEELGHNPEQFATECRSSIQNILSLKQKFNLDINVRLYNRKPIIRAIIFDDRALLSYYIGESGHIPIQFEIRSGEYSLLKMINLLYDELWNDSEPI